MRTQSDPALAAPGISAGRLRLLAFILATASGVSVANIFYSQPLLDLIARTYHTTEGSASIVVTVTQLGYAAGIIVLMPLGDLIENRALASRVLVVTAIAAALASTASSLTTFLVFSVLLGFTSVVAQIVIPVAAHLAPQDQRGRFVGQVMSGLLLGIMLARSASSLLADLWGWRSVYVVSAVLMLVMSVVLATTVPRRTPDHTDGYRTLMASIGHLVKTEPALRRRAVLQALMFATFSAFWTSIAYELIRQHHLSQAQIAIFALVGAAGAGAAPIAGRLGGPRPRPAGDRHGLRAGRHRDGDRRARRPQPHRPSGRWHPPRSRGAGQPGAQPAGDLPAQARCPLPHQHGVHRERLRRRCDRIGPVRPRL
jgi:predicted MFS family arabinose efflux permease